MLNCLNKIMVRERFEKIILPRLLKIRVVKGSRSFPWNLGPVHTNPDKFENGVFAPKTDKIFSVHAIVIVSFSIFSPSTLRLENETRHWP